METAKSSLTILFEDPFWIGLFERWQNNRYEACKVTFGSEPRDQEIFQFLLDRWSSLRFSPSIETTAEIVRDINPKRLQREIHRQLRPGTVGTKAQQALKLQQEQRQLDKKTAFRHRTQEEQEERFRMARQKKKEKHRGH